MTFNFLIKFDENGRREVTHVYEELSEEKRQELLDEGYIYITYDEWNLLVGNVDGHEYIRNPETGEFEIYVPPTPQLPELEAYKEQRKIELNTLHEASEKEAHILSSLGFEIDANDRANRDVTGLLVTTEEGEQVAFMDYSNQAHMVTRADLLVMQKEIIENAQYLYSQKWTFRAQIEACETSEALSYLNFQFSYKSFYQEPTDTGETDVTTE